MVRVDVDVRDEFEEDALGGLDHPVGHGGRDAGGPGHAPDPLDLALVQELLGPQQLPDGAGEVDLTRDGGEINLKKSHRFSKFHYPLLGKLMVYILWAL